LLLFYIWNPTLRRCCTVLVCTDTILRTSVAAVTSTFGAHRAEWEGRPRPLKCYSQFDESLEHSMQTGPPPGDRMWRSITRRPAPPAEARAVNQRIKTLLGKKKRNNSEFSNPFDHPLTHCPNHFVFLLFSDWSLGGPNFFPLPGSIFAVRAQTAVRMLEPNPVIPLSTFRSCSVPFHLFSLIFRLVL